MMINGAANRLNGQHVTYCFHWMLTESFADFGCLMGSEPGEKNSAEKAKYDTCAGGLWQ